jgi:hypothetical protein
MKKCFFLILLFFFNISKEQNITENWKKKTEEIISQIQSLLLIIQFTNYELYNKYSEYFDLLNDGLNRIKNVNSIEKQIEELKIIIVDFSSKIKDKIPKEQNINLLLNLFNEIIKNLSSNIEFIEKLIDRYNKYIEDEKKNVDNGYIKREKANYDPIKILNMKNIEIILFLLVLLFTVLLIIIGNRMIKKLKLKNEIEQVYNREIIIKKDNKNPKKLNQPLIENIYEMN